MTGGDGSCDGGGFDGGDGGGFGDGGGVGGGGGGGGGVGDGGSTYVLDQYSHCDHCRCHIQGSIHPM